MKILCSICNSTFSTKTNLTKHQKIKHGLAKINKCECGKEFESAQSLNAHYRWCLIHREGKPVIDTWQKGKPSAFKGKTASDTTHIAQAIKTRQENLKNGKWKPTLTGFALYPKMR
jgi:hypothetical protein